MSLTNFGAPEKADGAEKTLRHVLVQGVTLLNTASFYGQGLNEEIIGDSYAALVPCVASLESDQVFNCHNMNSRLLCWDPVHCNAYNRCIYLGLQGVLLLSARHCAFMNHWFAILQAA